MRSELLRSGDPSPEERGQSLSDVDQTSSGAEQGASERDQRGSDRDQHAADLDQAASDRMRANRGDSTLSPPTDHTRAGAERDRESTRYARTRRIRAQTTLDRDRDSRTRSEAAHVREATARRRDREADARDAAARVRDQLADAHDVEVALMEGSQLDDGTPGIAGGEIFPRASADRELAAAGRGHAAIAREHAARDRARGREDRRRAAADRQAAAEELAVEGIDHLTGTLRRRAGTLAIQREIDRTRRTHEPLVVGFIDVDGLKAVNDKQGHDAGDDLLFGIACCIKLALRTYDVVVRFGGDEFVCSLSGQDIAGARHRFAGIAADVAETQNGAKITVGFAERGEDESLENLVGRADAAMIASRAASR